jgi:hypothetical protein
MTRGRLLIAGLTAVAAMTATNASAQNCPEWLTLICPNEAVPVPAEESAPQGQAQQPGRTRGTSTSSTGSRTQQARPAGAAPARPAATANPNPQQTQAPAAARPVRTARPAMNAQEKEELFRQFLTWREERRQKSQNNR